MLRYLVLQIVVLVLVCVAVQAVDLPVEPVQNELRMGIATELSSSPQTVYAQRNSPFGDDNESDDPRFGRKSPFKAGLLSAVLPGAGQVYCGANRTARYFLAAEAASWIGYFAYRQYGSWKEDDYIRYAAQHAGIDLEGQPDWYVDFVGFYDDVYQYNELGRAIGRERPYLDPDEDHWHWDDFDNKMAFRQVKNSSREAFRRADFMIGAMVVNRLVSIIHAVRTANRTGRRLDDLAMRRGPRIDYGVHVDPFSDHVSVAIKTKF